MEPQGPFCQSCAMPLSQKNCCGTKKDGSRSEKYCLFCFKDGKFTMPNATLDEMIEISAKGWSDQDPNMSYEEAKKFLKVYLPNLERWKQY